MGWDDDDGRRADPWDGGWDAPGTGWDDTRDTGWGGGFSPADTQAAASTHTAGGERSSAMRIAIVGGIATIIGAVIAALIGAVVVIWTDDPPDPPPPTSVSAEVRSVQPTVPSPCCTFAVEVEARGFKGRTITLEYQAIAASTGSVTELGRQDLTFEADQEEASPEVEAPAGSLPADYYSFVFQLRDSNGVLLHRFPTAPEYVG